MSSMHVADRRGKNAASYSPDLVVAVEHTQEVLGALEGFGVRVGEVEESQDLGLSLVPLRDRAAAAESAAEPVDLDDLLQRLRGHFSEKYATWVPTVGKNRLLGEVVGGGKISHGGALAPALSSEQPAAREARPGRGVRVGVLDTAIASHEWLAGGWVAAPGEVLPPKVPQHAAAGHATFITGLVLREAPGCVVVARQVLSDDGLADSWTVAQAIVEHGREGLDVLNLSLFCHTDDGQPPLVLARALERLPSETVVVAAAGNHGDDGADPAARRRPAWPAALDGVIAVGATDGAGEEASFSPQGVPWVDVLAPGVDRVSTYLSCDVAFDDGGTEEFQGLARWSGTSFAAASVSGVIAARTVPGQVSARQAWEGMRAGRERRFTLELGA